MSLFELGHGRRSRFRVFIRAQLPLLLCVVFLAVSVAVFLPSAFTSAFFITGLALIAVASAAAVVLPWETTAASWMISIAVADILGVAFIRAELYNVAGISVLVIFPVLWLAYGFRLTGAIVAVGGTMFVSVFPYLVSGSRPVDGTAWLGVVILPVLIVGVAVVVNLAAVQLRGNRRKLAAASQDQAVALRRALDNEILSQSILDAVDAGIAFYSAENELVLSNRLAEQMAQDGGFRLDQPPYASPNLLSTDRGTPIPLDEQMIPRVLRGETVENHMQWVNTPERHAGALASSRQVRREDGELLGTVIVAYDITELANAIADRDEFLGTVSHELRTPLTSVLGYLELIADDIDPSEVTTLRYVETVRRSMASLADRMKYLLSASETDLVLNRKPIDIGTVVASSIERVADDAALKGITVENEIERSETVTADQARIAQAVEELLTNALKFGAAGSTVTVSQESDTESVTLGVTGISSSITPAEQARIFDRFFRGQNARDGAVQGFGLGLFIVTNIMTAHHGSIAMNETPGGGKRFTLVLPREADGPGTKSSAASNDWLLRGRSA